MTDSITMVENAGARIGIRTLTARRNIGGIDMVAVACGNELINPLDLASFSTRTHVMDLRGQSISGGQVEESSGANLEDYLTDFDTTLKAVGAEDAVPSAGRGLFGYSHGGYFTTQYALTRPDRIAALVLVEPALYTDPDDLRIRAELASGGHGTDALRQMLDFVDGNPSLTPDPQRARKRTDDLASRIREDWVSDQAIANEFRVRLENPVTDEQLAKLQVPTLVIGGTDSVVRSMASRAAAAIPNASLWWVRGADHLSLMSREHAAEVAQVVTAFVGQVS